MIWTILYLAIGLMSVVAVVLLVMVLVENECPARPYDWERDGDR